MNTDGALGAIIDRIKNPRIIAILGINLIVLFSVGKFEIPYEDYSLLLPTLSVIVLLIFHGMEAWKGANANKNEIAINNNGESGINALIVKHHSPERKHKFADMNNIEEIANGLDVFGVGITNVTNNIGLLRDLLKRGKNINLCMINPDIVKSDMCKDKTLCPSNNNQEAKEKDLLHLLNLLIWKNHFDEYFNRRDYSTEISASYKRLVDEIGEIKRDVSYSGEVTLKRINTFIPVSINVVDKNSEKSKLIMEYNLPLTEHRILMSLNKSDAPVFYEQIIEFYNAIWRNAEFVITNK